MSHLPRSVLSRPERSRRLRAAKRRARMEVSIVAAIAVLSLLLGWQAVRPGTARTDRPAQAEPAPSAVAAEQIGVDCGTGIPTPFFASHESLHLYLPVATQELTEIAFHQASGDKAYHMTSMLPDADMTAAADKQGTRRTVTTDTVGPQVLTGSVLRMWRSNRTGAPDTAADIGAKPGALVFAPVTGTVLQVKPYRLYDKYDDYEIHIQPAGWSDIDVVIIHIDKPTVKAGDHVVGGCTQLAQVRKLSHLVTPQLSEYTVDAGDHVHLQLNKVVTPGQLDALDGS